MAEYINVALAEVNSKNGSGVGWGWNIRVTVAVMVTEATPRRRGEREREITLRPVLPLKNSGAGVDGARTAVMVREVESSLGRRLLAAKAISAGRLISPLFLTPPLIVCHHPCGHPHLQAGGRTQRTHPHTNLSTDERTILLIEQQFG